MIGINRDIIIYCGVDFNNRPLDLTKVSNPHVTLTNGSSFSPSYSMQNSRIRIAIPAANTRVGKYSLKIDFSADGKYSEITFSDIFEISDSVPATFSALDEGGEVIVEVFGEIGTGATWAGYAKQQGDYAKQQGDYAKTRADSVKDGKTPRMNAGSVVTGQTAEVTVVKRPSGDEEGNPQYDVNFIIPKGDKGADFKYSDFTDAQLDALRGDTGYTPYIQIGDVEAGDTPSADIVENGVGIEGNPIYSLSLVMPRGLQGFTPVFEIGDILTLEPSEKATADIKKTGDTVEGNPVYSLTISIPKGEPGLPGEGSGNVNVQGESLLAGKKYLFVPSFDGSTSGSFSEYAPEDQIQPDWNASEGAGYILNKPSIPAKTSDITNDSDYITSSVKNLAEYYLKSETYSRSEVADLLSAITSVRIKKVDFLPSVGESNVIYFVSKSGTGNDLYDEYIYIDDKPEYIGSTQIDLSGYVEEAPKDGKSYARNSGGWDSVKSAYDDAVFKGYIGTKDEFDTLLAGIGTAGVGEYLDLSFMQDSEGNFVSSVTQDTLDLVKQAYDNNIIACRTDGGNAPMIISFSDGIFIINIIDGIVHDGVAKIMVAMLTINVVGLNLKVDVGVPAPEIADTYLDMSPLYDSSNNLLEYAPTEFLEKLQQAYENRVIAVFLMGRTFTANIVKQGSLWDIHIYMNTVFQEGVQVSGINYSIRESTRAIENFSNSANIEVKGSGEKALMDNGRYKDVISTTDVFSVASLSSLSNTKYSQLFTYTTATAQPINFASTPAVGFECMLDIKNSTSSDITQAIPNAAAWQCEETSLVIPAGKVGCISIRYVHGIYCVRVGL